MWPNPFLSALPNTQDTLKIGTQKCILPPKLPKVGEISTRQRKFAQSGPGLPDGLFSNQKSTNLGKFWTAFE
jgi:hypothetical protein